MEAPAAPWTKYSVLQAPRIIRARPYMAMLSPTKKKIFCRSDRVILDWNKEKEKYLYHGCHDFNVINKTNVQFTLDAFEPLQKQDQLNYSEWKKWKELLYRRCWLLQEKFKVTFMNRTFKSTGNKLQIKENVHKHASFRHFVEKNMHSCMLKCMIT